MTSCPTLGQGYNFTLGFDSADFDALKPSSISDNIWIYITNFPGYKIGEKLSDITYIPSYPLNITPSGTLEIDIPSNENGFATLIVYNLFVTLNVSPTRACNISITKIEDNNVIQNIVINFYISNIIDESPLKNDHLSAECIGNWLNTIITNNNFSVDFANVPICNNPLYEYTPTISESFESKYDFDFFPNIFRKKIEHLSGSGSITTFKSPSQTPSQTPSQPSFYTPSSEQSKLLNKLINNINSYVRQFNTIYITIQNSGSVTDLQNSTLSTLTSQYINNVPQLLINSSHSLLFPLSLPLNVTNVLYNKYAYINDSMMNSVFGLSTILNDTTNNQYTQLSLLIKIILLTNRTLSSNNYVITGLKNGDALEFIDNPNLIIYINNIPSSVPSNSNNKILKLGNYIEILNIYLQLISDSDPIMFNISSTKPNNTRVTLTPTSTPTSTPSLQSQLSNSIILNKINNSMINTLNIHKNDSVPDDCITLISSTLSSQLVSDVIEINNIPMSTLYYYNNIINKVSSITKLISKPIVGISTIQTNDINTQIIKFSALIKTVGNLVVIPIDPGNTIKIYDNNNVLLTTIYRGTNNNSNQIKQDDSNWISMGLYILINGYRFNILAFGSPGLWESIGNISTQQSTVRYSISNITNMIPTYYNSDNNLYYYNFVFVILIMAVIMAIFYGIYQSISEDTINSKYSEI
jgi:hypothetical protein